MDVQARSSLQFVVCASSAAYRRQMSSAVERAGGRVLIETDVAFEASAVAERFSADVVLIDVDVTLALGSHLLDEMDRSDRSFHIVLLCEEAAETDLTRARFTAVERFDSVALDRALARLGDRDSSDRRRNSTVASASAQILGNRAEPGRFFTAVNDAAPGDAMVIVTCPDQTELDRLEAVCSVALRDTDLVLRQSAEVIMFLPGGEEVGPKAAIDRVKDRWSRPDELRHLTVVIGSLPPSESFSDALRSFRRAAETLSL